MLYVWYLHATQNWSVRIFQEMLNSFNTFVFFIRRIQKKNFNFRLEEIVFKLFSV